MRRYRIVVRSGPKVDKYEADSLDAALEVVEREGRVASAGPGRRPVKLRKREFKPVHQVAARVEVRGDRVRAGVDVRGDGSVEAWTGGWRRSIVEPQRRESAYAALRRVLTGDGS